ncbi:hypothetical protein FQR65_LT05444 [Abscondita terminalis]|nr:hypothetical protein FQR65_LT05444 [Abscondita terminalis]
MAARNLKYEEIMQDIDEDNSEGDPLQSSEEEWEQLPTDSDLSSDDGSSDEHITSPTVDENGAFRQFRGRGKLEVVVHAVEVEARANRY